MHPLLPGDHIFALPASNIAAQGCCSHSSILIAPSLSLLCSLSFLPQKSHQFPLSLMTREAAFSDPQIFRRRKHLINPSLSLYLPGKAPISGSGECNCFLQRHRPKERVKSSVLCTMFPVCAQKPLLFVTLKALQFWQMG